MTVSPISRAVRHVFTSEPNNPCPGETFGKEANTCGQLQRTGTQRPLFPAGVQEETQQPPAQAVGRRCQHSCPRWGAGQREALWVEGVQSCPAEAQGKVQGSSGKTDIPAAESPCPLQPSTPQIMLGKKRSLWSRSPTKDLFIIARQLTVSWPLCRLKALPSCRSCILGKDGV